MAFTRNYFGCIVRGVSIRAKRLPIHHPYNSPLSSHSSCHGRYTLLWPLEAQETSPTSVHSFTSKAKSQAVKLLLF